jgi:hypothetical protein
MRYAFNQGSNNDLWYCYEISSCQHPYYSRNRLIFVNLFPFSSLWLCSPCKLWRLFQFLSLYTVDSTPWTGISPSQGHYLHTEQHKHGMNAHKIHALSGIRTQDLSFRVDEDGWSLRPRSNMWSAYIPFNIMKLMILETTLTQCVIFRCST